MSSTGKPSFDKLPDVQLNQPLPPFRAWVQMAIPTVYDDSLSYSELLYKVINYLNTTNEHLTTDDETIKAFYHFLYGADGTGTTDGLYHDIVTWFDELQVDATLEAKVQSIMDTWALPYNPDISGSGTVDEKISTLIEPEALNRAKDTAENWLDENIHQEAGYVLDTTLSLPNTAAEAKAVGTAFLNIGMPYFGSAVGNNISNNRVLVGDSSTGLFTPNPNSIMYQYIPLPKYNKLIVYPKIQGKINYAILKNTSTSQSDVVTYTEGGVLKYAVGSLAEATDPIKKRVLDYSRFYTNDISNLYIRISIQTVSTALDVNRDKDVLNFIYDDSPLQAIIGDVSADNINGGFPEYRPVTNQVIRLNGTLSDYTTGLFYGYIPLPKSSNKIYVHTKINGSLTYVITNAEDLTSSTRLHEPVNLYPANDVTEIDYTRYLSQENLYLAISIQAGRDLNIETDKNTLEFMYGNGVVPTLSGAIYGTNNRNLMPSCMLRYNYFNTISSDYGVSNIRNMGDNTRLYAYAWNNATVDLIKSFINNAGEGEEPDYPINILKFGHYVFTKISLLDFQYTPSTHSKIDMYYIQDLDKGILCSGYANNDTDSPSANITWRGISGGGGTPVENNYYNTFNTYTSEYTGDMYCSPTITTDTNNVLAALTGEHETDDRTNDIYSMLYTTGCCILGTGTFYVKKLVMPPNSELRGMGNKTIIKWKKDSDTNNKYMIQLGKNCTVGNLQIDAEGGGDDNPYNPFYVEEEGVTPDENKPIGDFTAILLTGTTTDNCMLNDLYIRNCVGSAIKTDNTGIGMRPHLLATNCNIYNCDCGVYNVVKSEFHKFTNIHIQNCYYGCIVYGGNIDYMNGNIANCHFSITVSAPDSESETTNHAHGSFIGIRCVHSSNIYGESVPNDTPRKEGVHVNVLGVTMGEKFAECTFGYGAVNVNGSKGIKFYGCGFARSDINTTGGSGIIFCNCGITSDVVFNNNGTGNIHVDNSYTLTGNAWNPVV